MQQADGITVCEYVQQFLSMVGMTALLPSENGGLL